MINYNKVGKFANLKYECLHFYNSNKFRLLIIAFLIVLFLLTGIFTALKVSDMEKALKLVEFSFESLVDGDIYTFSFFVKRFISILLVMGLLYVFALTKYTYALGFLLIGYRSFLLALNCALIIRYMGIGAVLNCLIIIICQLLQLLFMSLFFVIVGVMAKEKRTIGGCDKSKWSSCLIYIILASFLVNIIELILLLIFKASTILII